MAATTRTADPGVIYRALVVDRYTDAAWSEYLRARIPCERRPSPRQRQRGSVMTTTYRVQRGARIYRTTSPHTAAEARREDARVTARATTRTTADPEGK